LFSPSFELSDARYRRGYWLCGAVTGLAIQDESLIEVIEGFPRVAQPGQGESRGREHVSLTIRIAYLSIEVESLAVVVQGLLFVSEIGIREADVIQSAAFLIPRGDLVLGRQGLVEVVERLLWLAELAVDIAIFTRTRASPCRRRPGG